MISDEFLKYLNGFFLAIPKNYEDLFDQSSFSDNTPNTVNHKSRLMGIPLFHIFRMPL
jgi:hypothetical protein